MKTFNYTVKDSIGIHARPAGLLAKLAKGYQSDITLEKDGKSADATRLVSLMTLGVRHGDTVTVRVNGADEDEAAKAIALFFEQNL